MGEKWCNRTVRLPDGFTVNARVFESELQGTDEEFLARHPEVRKIVERWAAEEREWKAAD